MTKINPVTQNNQYKKPMLNPKNTGIAAGIAMTITTLRAISNKKIIKKTTRSSGILQQD